MSIETLSDLQIAEDGSFYTISGCGGDLKEWVNGYEGLLKDAQIGKPTTWWQTTGAAINAHAGETGDPYPDDVVVLLFPLDGLDTGRLAMFKIRHEDRWFDDIVQNMRVR